MVRGENTTPEAERRNIDVLVLPNHFGFGF